MTLIPRVAPHDFGGAKPHPPCRGAANRGLQLMVYAAGRGLLLMVFAAARGLLLMVFAAGRGLQ